MQTAHELFLHELSDMLSAEKTLVDALQEQEQAASRADLKKAFASHRAQTEKQVERLTRVFESVGEEPEEKECKGVEGLVEEFKNFLGESPSPDILDTVAVGAAKKVENYEIVAYESLIELAEQMGHDEAAKLLQQNLREEESTLEKLERLGKKIQPRELGMGEEEEEGRKSAKSAGRRRGKQAA